jgi:signal transduction histidine kinase
LGICRTDADGYVIYGNDAWRAHYGFDRGQVLLPQPWLPFVNEQDLEAKKDFFKKLQKNPGPETCEFRLKNETFTLSEGGRTYTNDVYVLATGFSNIRQDGTPEYIDFWVTDISAQKMAAKILADKMEEGERFMDMISHEIRNPLSAILQCGEEIVDAMKIGHAALDAMRQDAASPVALVPHRQSLKNQLDGSLDAANTIIYCVQHQKQIVDDVLTLSKLDSDLLLVSPSPVELMSIVKSSLKIFELQLKATNITLTIVEDDSLATLGVDWVMLDPKRFLQIIINLVTNAIKFTKKSVIRRITIKASAHKERPAADILDDVEYVPQRYRPKKPISNLSSQTDLNSKTDSRPDVFLSFSVTDTGLGLTESQKALLFNRFAQASPKTHIEYGGSGLGLFISRQITEMLDGQIGVSSTPGVGSTFAFYIKAQKAPRPPPFTPAVEPNIRLSSSLGLVSEEKYRQPTVDLKTRQLEQHLPSMPPRAILPRSILVVEDNRINQKVLCKQLRNRKFLVHPANHGREALDAMFAKRQDNDAQDFDVVLCDIEMPIMDGIEFTKEIRRLESLGELVGHIPILGVTANVRSTQVSGAIDAGMACSFF